MDKTNSCDVQSATGPDGIVQYPCSKCDECYNTASSLTNHNFREHNPKGKFICERCGKTLYSQFRNEHVEKCRIREERKENKTIKKSTPKKSKKIAQGDPSSVQDVPVETISTKRKRGRPRLNDPETRRDAKAAEDGFNDLYDHSFATGEDDRKRLCKMTHKIRTKVIAKRVEKLKVEKNVLVTKLASHISKRLSRSHERDNPPSNTRPDEAVSSEDVHQPGEDMEQPHHEIVEDNLEDSHPPNEINMDDVEAEDLMIIEDNPTLVLEHRVKELGDLLEKKEARSLQLETELKAAQALLEKEIEGASKKVEQACEPLSKEIEDLRSILDKERQDSIETLENVRGPLTNELKELKAAHVLLEKERQEASEKLKIVRVASTNEVQDLRIILEKERQESAENLKQTRDLMKKEAQELLILSEKKQQDSDVELHKVRDLLDQEKDRSNLLDTLAKEAQMLLGKEIEDFAAELKKLRDRLEEQEGCSMSLKPRLKAAHEMLKNERQDFPATLKSVREPLMKEVQDLTEKMLTTKLLKKLPETENRLKNYEQSARSHKTDEKVVQDHKEKCNLPSLEVQQKLVDSFQNLPIVIREKHSLAPQREPASRPILSSSANSFLGVEQIVDHKFETMLPTLERVAKDAPNEIMRRLVQSSEMKSAFPSVADYICQLGIHYEHTRIRAATGIMEPTRPTLPGQYERGVNFYEIKIGMKMRFKNTGAWGALAEVREWLERVLKSLEGDGRFRMYEPNTLNNFWRLLFWANELWRSILFEEENEELVERHKKLWVKELEEWTGLVLKCDWRDYFVIELEVEVRKLTLGILESIVTAGYFEQTKKRHDILYRVLKDTLSKDAFRDAQNVQRILKILTWSISDAMIMKNLCFGANEKNCLARLIGENVLKVCRQETDATSVAVLYLDYLYLLESLMMDKPIAHHHSKFARSESKIRQPAQALEQPEMDVDLMGSQLACPVNSTTVVPEQVELSDEDLNCWLDPVKYEDPYGKLKLCQCRQVMMGTAISVLHVIFGFWRKSYKDYEADIESRHVEEETELEGLERVESSLTRPSDILSPVEQKCIERQKERLKFLRDKKAFLAEFLPKVNEALRKGSGDSEWDWDDILRKGREITSTPLPQWLYDYKRQGNVLDLCISKGIFLLNFLRTRSEELADAIGTEAYKEYMIMIPFLRIHMDKLDLNRVNYDILASMTSDCEEGHQSNNNSDGNTQSTNSLVPPEDIEDVVQKIEYNLNLKDLTASDCKELQRTSTNDMKKMQTTERSRTEVECIHKSLFTLREEEFLRKSGFVANS